eukprot:GHVN01051070.1.p1 GENE.GHVN01051070.1~~GHVN01051070.1.p1  ORF type:complete len:1331 (+),score=113.96 GHVN01051070.1:624-4616(+)
MFPHSHATRPIQLYITRIDINSTQCNQSASITLDCGEHHETRITSIDVVPYAIEVSSTLWCQTSMEQTMLHIFSGDTSGQIVRHDIWLTGELADAHIQSMCISNTGNAVVSMQTHLTSFLTPDEQRDTCRDGMKKAMPRGVLVVSGAVRNHVIVGALAPMYIESDNGFPIGSKSHQEEFSAILMPMASTDGEQNLTSATQNAVIVSARPGGRVWIANSRGEVQQTLKYSSTDEGPDRQGKPRTHIQKLQYVGQGHFVAWRRSGSSYQGFPVGTKRGSDGDVSIQMPRCECCGDGTKLVLCSVNTVQVREMGSVPGQIVSLVRFDDNKFRIVSVVSRCIPDTAVVPSPKSIQYSFYNSTLAFSTSVHTLVSSLMARVSDSTWLIDPLSNNTALETELGFISEVMRLVSSPTLNKELTRKSVMTSPLTMNGLVDDDEVILLRHNRVRQILESLSSMLDMYRYNTHTGDTTPLAHALKRENWQTAHRPSFLVLNAVFPTSYECWSAGTEQSDREQCLVGLINAITRLEKLFVGVVDGWERELWVTQSAGSFVIFPTAPTTLPTLDTAVSPLSENEYGTSQQRNETKDELGAAKLSGFACTTERGRDFYFVRQFDMSMGVKEVLVPVCHRLSSTLYDHVDGTGKVMELKECLDCFDFGGEWLLGLHLSGRLTPDQSPENLFRPEAQSGSRPVTESLTRDKIEVIDDTFHLGEEVHGAVGNSGRSCSVAQRKHCKLEFTEELNCSGITGYRIALGCDTLRTESPTATNHSLDQLPQNAPTSYEIGHRHRDDGTSLGLAEDPSGNSPMARPIETNAALKCSAKATPTLKLQHMKFQDAIRATVHRIGSASSSNVASSLIPFTQDSERAHSKETNTAHRLFREAASAIKEGGVSKVCVDGSKKSLYNASALLGAIGGSLRDVVSGGGPESESSRVIDEAVNQESLYCMEKNGRLMDEANRSKAVLHVISSKVAVQLASRMFARLCMLKGSMLVHLCNDRNGGHSEGTVAVEPTWPKLIYNDIGRVDLPVMGSSIFSQTTSMGLIRFLTELGTLAKGAEKICQDPIKESASENFGLDQFSPLLSFIADRWDEAMGYRFWCDLIEFPLQNVLKHGNDEAMIDKGGPNQLAMLVDDVDEAFTIVNGMGWVVLREKILLCVGESTSRPWGLIGVGNFWRLHTESTRLNTRSSDCLSSGSDLVDHCLSSFPSILPANVIFCLLVGSDPTDVGSHRPPRCEVICLSSTDIFVPIQGSRSTDVVSGIPRRLRVPVYRVRLLIDYIARVIPCCGRFSNVGDLILVANRLNVAVRRRDQSTLPAIYDADDLSAQVAKSLDIISVRN